MELMFSTNEKANLFKGYLEEFCLTYKRTKQEVFLFSKQHYYDQYKKVFAKFITQIISPEWMRSTLMQKFYYEDESEINEILQIAGELCNDQREELHVFLDLNKKDKLLNDAVDELLKYDGFLQFESFTRFRLRAYFEELQKILEQSIDEYKLEQEYQNYIHYLQNELQKNPTQMSDLYVFLIKEPLFFDDQLQEITKERMSEYKQMYEIQANSFYPMDPTIIAPLISIAPQKIILFTRNRDQSIIYTLEKIFEERIKVIEMTE